MNSGTIVALVLDRHFGFIHERTGQPDIFFHASDLVDGLEYDEQLHQRRVEFDVIETPKGPRAANVRAAE